MLHDFHADRAGSAVDLVTSVSASKGGHECVFGSRLSRVNFPGGLSSPEAGVCRLMIGSSNSRLGRREFPVDAATGISWARARFVLLSLHGG
jgi:hypothetical protein